MASANLLAANIDKLPPLHTRCSWGNCVCWDCFSPSSVSSLRQFGYIDLIRCEEGIVSFVELKRMDDGRMLHEDDQSPEIVDQMNRYRLFVQNYSQKLLRYYQKVYDLKQSLNLPVPHIRPNLINPEPLLIIFDRWVKCHPQRDLHRQRVQEILGRENIHYTILTDL